MTQVGAAIDARPTLRGLRAWWRGRTTLDEIAPGLFMGGFPHARGAIHLALEVLGIDHVVTTTYKRPVLAAGTTSVHIPFLDLDLPLDLEPILHAARDVVRRLREGQRIYVHCGHGLDRSGLVVALALREMLPGRTGVEILDLIRARRGSEALHNRRFARFVRALAPIHPGSASV